MKNSVITTPTEFRDWCSNLKPIWAFDCETTSLDWLNLEIIGWSICDGKQACYVDISACEANTRDSEGITKRRYKKELLMILDFYISEAKMIVMQNAPFDMMALLKEGIEI